jgi:hypothetical protein
VRTNEVITITFVGNTTALLFDTNFVTDPQGEYPAFAAHALFAYAKATLSWAITPIQLTASNSTISVVGHTLRLGERITFAPNGLPSEINSGAWYYVQAIDGDQFSISAERGGPKITFGAPTPPNYAWTPMRQPVGPYGFEYLDDDAIGFPRQLRTTILSVNLASTNQVRITLSNIPTGNFKRIKYGSMALMATDGGFGGRQSGPRGCLRDADPTTSLYGDTLYNWCVHFDKPVP